MGSVKPTDADSETPFDKKPPTPEITSESGVKVFTFSTSEDQGCADYNALMNDPDIEMGPTAERILDNGTCVVMVYFTKSVEIKK